MERGKDWHIMGAVDLGPLVNNLEEISNQRTELEVATHYFQYIYIGLNGFHWPVAYCGSNNVDGHGIYLTFWLIIDTIASYGFKVHAALMDRSSNN